MRVDINLLGGFSVVVDGRPVAAQAWTRRNAATLVKLLALRPGRRLPREQLIDLLWPDLLLDAGRAAPAQGRPLRPDGAGRAERRGAGRRRGHAAPRRRGRGRRRALRRLGRPVAGRGGDRPLPRRPAARRPLRGLGRRRARAAARALPGPAASGRSLGRPGRGRAARRGGAPAPGPAVRRGRRPRQALRHLDSFDAAVARASSASIPVPARPALRARGRVDVAVRPGAAGAQPQRDAGAPPRHPDRRARPRRRPRADPARGQPAGHAARHRRSGQDAAGGGGGAPLRRGDLAAHLLRRPDQGVRPRARGGADRARARHPVGREPERRADAGGGAAPAVAAARARQLRARRRRRRPGRRDGPVVRRPPRAGDQPGAAAGRRGAGLRGPSAARPGRAHGADAVALFEQVATGVDPHFELAHHLATCTAICRVGRRAAAGDRDRRRPPPHAVAVAAARAAGQPARLGDPAGRDLPDRQQTIPATIDWSLQLLGPAEQRLFARLSVFQGAVPLEAVEASGPTGDVVDPLSVLVDHSLVRRTTGNRRRAPLRDAGAGAPARRPAAADDRAGCGDAARRVRRGVRRGPLRAPLDRRGRSLARRHHRAAPGGAGRARLGRSPRRPRR